MTDSRTLALEKEEAYRSAFKSNARIVDRIFIRLLFLQWAAGVVLALVVAPRTWIGTHSEIHVHVWAAVALGGLLTLFPWFVQRRRPGEAITRHVIAIAQTLFSALLIHLSGGRIETHFHVFGSLAFLAVYRDWRVLITATIVVAVDHILRGFLPPEISGVILRLLALRLTPSTFQRRFDR